VHPVYCKFLHQYTCRTFARKFKGLNLTRSRFPLLFVVPHKFKTVTISIDILLFLLSISVSVAVILLAAAIVNYLVFGENRSEFIDL
jgi:hypothetical protein